MAEILNEFEEYLENDSQDNSAFIEEESSNISNQEIYEDDESVDTSEENEGNSSQEDVPDYKDNALYSFLQSKGIKDPSKISFENEDGTTEEHDFNSLSVEDQLEVFNQVTDPGLSEDEIRAINYMRQNGNATLEQIVDFFSNQRLDDYLQKHPEDVPQKTYSIDEYTDDDLYLVDLKRRYPNFTDEELISKLDAAKSNEELFKKEAEVLRNTYKALEDQAALEKDLQEKQQIEDLRTNLMNAASQFNEIQLDYTDDKSESLVIEAEDKQQMLSYLLDQDQDGKSQLVRDLENPDTLIELAWLRTKGADVLSDLTKYWKKLLTEERANNKKLQTQINKLTKKDAGSVVIPQDPVYKNKSNEGSVWDNSGLI